MVSCRFSKEIWFFPTKSMGCAAIGLLLGQRQVATQRQHTFGPLESLGILGIPAFSGATTEKYGRTMILTIGCWCFPEFSDEKPVHEHLQSTCDSLHSSCLTYESAIVLSLRCLTSSIDQKLEMSRKNREN